MAGKTGVKMLSLIMRATRSGRIKLGNHSPRETVEQLVQIPNDVNRATPRNLRDNVSCPDFRLKRGHDDEIN